MLQQMRTTAKWIWLFLFAAFVGVFLFADTSGLIGGAAITPTTAVAEVNGRDILYTEWQQRVSQAMQNQQRSGASLSQDEVRQIEDDVLNEMIMQVLLDQDLAQPLRPCRPWKPAPRPWSRARAKIRRCLSCQKR